MTITDFPRRPVRETTTAKEITVTWNLVAQISTLMLVATLCIGVVRNSGRR